MVGEEPAFEDLGTPDPLIRHSTELRCAAKLRHPLHKSTFA